jgi:DNA-binding NarL/FixJ family response regulator
MKFIIVDDNEWFRLGVKEYLETILKHHVIAIAKNGDEFLKLPNISEADIVLMDNKMPGKNGVEVSKQYLTDFPNSKIIVLTMDITMFNLQEIKDAGIAGCIEKRDIYNQLKHAVDAIKSGEKYYIQEK